MMLTVMMMVMMVVVVMIMVIVMVMVMMMNKCDGKPKEAYDEEQRVWLVDPTLFFPSPTPPPKIEVWW